MLCIALSLVNITIFHNQMDGRVMQERLKQFESLVQEDDPEQAEVLTNCETSSCVSVLNKPRDLCEKQVHVKCSF